MKKAFFVMTILALVSILFITGCEKGPIRPSNPYISDLKLSSASGYAREGEEFQVFFTIENPIEIRYTPYIIVQYDENVIDRVPYVNQIERTTLEDLNAGSSRNYHITFRAVGDISNVRTPESKITIFLMGEEEGNTPIDTKTILVKVSE